MTHGLEDKFSHTNFRIYGLYWKKTFCAELIKPILPIAQTSSPTNLVLLMLYLGNVKFINPK